MISTLERTLRYVRFIRMVDERTSVALSNLLNQRRPSMGSSIWNETVRGIASDPNDLLFLTCFEHLVGRAERDDPVFANLLSTVARADSETAFEVLLKHLVYDGAIARAEHWRLLLKAEPVDGDRGRWFDRMAAVAHENLPDATVVGTLILNADHRMEIEARLAADLTV